LQTQTELDSDKFFENSILREVIGKKSARGPEREV